MTTFLEITCLFNLLCSHVVALNLLTGNTFTLFMYVNLRLFGSALDLMKFFNVTMPRYVQEKQSAPDRMHRL